MAIALSSDQPVIARLSRKHPSRSAGSRVVVAAVRFVLVGRPVARLEGIREFVRVDGDDCTGFVVLNRKRSDNVVGNVLRLVKRFGVPGDLAQFLDRVVGKPFDDEVRNRVVGDGVVACTPDRTQYTKRFADYSYYFNFT